MSPKHDQHELKFDLRQNQTQKKDGNNDETNSRRYEFLSNYNVWILSVWMKIRRFIVQNDVFLWLTVVTHNYLDLAWFSFGLKIFYHIQDKYFVRKKRLFSHLSERHRFTGIFNNQNGNTVKAKNEHSQIILSFCLWCDRFLFQTYKYLFVVVNLADFFEMRMISFWRCIKSLMVEIRIVVCSSLF